MSHFTTSFRVSFLLTTSALSLMLPLLLLSGCPHNMNEPSTEGWMYESSNLFRSRLSTSPLRDECFKIRHFKFIDPGFSRLNIFITSVAVAIGILIAGLLLFFHKPVANVKHSHDPCYLTEPRDLVRQIQTDHARLRLLEDQNTAQSEQIKQLQNTLTSRQASIDQLGRQAAGRQNHIAQLNAQLNHARQSLNIAQINNNAFLQKQAAQSTSIGSITSQLVTRNTELQITVAQLEKERKMRLDLQFENEVLKCTTSPSPPPGDYQSSSFAAFAAPFVIVAVDGDAYKWSSSHFVQHESPAGAHAAQAIKTQVQQYLLKNQSKTSLQARIVVRVFQNGDGFPRCEPRGPNAAKRRLNDFAIDFSESAPLFDYIDCGRGKERADSKIQEMFHLFIANPLCQTIFLAAATDNGFARLLEQYACIEAAKEKVVLVHPGYVIREIASLQYEAVEWPSVFKNQSMPVAAQGKLIALNEAKEKERLKKEIFALRIIRQQAFGLGDFADLQKVKVGLRK